MPRLITIALIAQFLGCATSLSVTEVEEKDQVQTQPGADGGPPVHVASKVNGVRVNRRVRFRVTLEPAEIPVGPGTIYRFDGQTSPLVGIHQNKTLEVNIRRGMFASGNLGLKLTALESLKEVSVSSETGAVRSIEAITAAVEASRELREE